MIRPYSGLIFYGHTNVTILYKCAKLLQKLIYVNYWLIFQKIEVLFKYTKIEY